jgi:hypothetical protein
MALSTDGKTGATGITPTVTISKNGGAFASPAGAVTEIANGFYKVAPNATDSNTFGPIALHATAAGCDNADRQEWSVVAYDPQAATNLGLSLLDAAITTRAAASDLPANFDVLSINASGHVSRVTLTDTLTTYTGNTPQTGDSFARIGVAGAGLTAITANTSLIIGGRILARSPILDNGQYLILVRGDDYNIASGQALEWTDPRGNWPTLTSATITLTIRAKEDDGSGGDVVLTQAGSVVTATGDDKQVRVEPLYAKTSLLEPGNKEFLFDVQAVLTGGERVTLIKGECTVIEDVTTT